jgi:hypothetical protein
VRRARRSLRDFDDATPATLLQESRAFTPTIGHEVRANQRWEVNQKTDPEEKIAAYGKDARNHNKSAGSGVHGHGVGNILVHIPQPLQHRRKQRGRPTSSLVTRPVIFHKTRYSTLACSRNVQMSVPSNLEMSVSPVVSRAVGGDVGDGAEHERCGAFAARGSTQT